MLRRIRPGEENLSDPTSPATSESTGRQPFKPLPSRTGTDKLLNILIGGLGLIVIALVISLIIRLNSSPGGSDGHDGQQTEVTSTDEAGNQVEQNVQVKSKTVRVEILNGAGVPKLASRAADYLRAKGFDVVKTDNAPHGNFKKSVVQDRIGDIDKARAIASSLGIGEAGVLQQKNPQLYLDVTVILGQDYKTLKFMTSGKQP
ncbi:LytR C-terminal domain-containing protein [bacterium]|nr:LytR C-terminal domain-containing protein [bacterium]